MNTFSKNLYFLIKDLYIQDGKQSENNCSFVRDPEQSVSACLICFENLPDTVVMECGHGG